MTKAQPASPTNLKRGLLARPLDALVFLAPLMVFYQLVSLSRPERVIAFDLLQWFFELFGQAGVWAPGLSVVVVLLATHVASGEKWVIHWKRVGLMYVEAAGLAIPLLALNWSIPLAPPLSPGTAAIHEIAFGIGAGVYEELVFRLILISVLVMVGTDLFRLDRTVVAAFAIAASSALFAAHHHRPIGAEPFVASRFVFRLIAGIYLAVVFWYRGYGPAAGCHAAYNAGLVASDAWVA